MPSLRVGVLATQDAAGQNVAPGHAAILSPAQRGVKSFEREWVRKEEGALSVAIACVW